MSRLFQEDPQEDITLSILNDRINHTEISPGTNRILPLRPFTCKIKIGIL